MNLEELREAFNNPQSTVLEKTIASAIKKSIEKGDLYSLETLMNRVYGKPKEPVDITTDGESIRTIQIIPASLKRKNVNKGNNNK